MKKSLSKVKAASLLVGVVYLVFLISEQNINPVQQIPTTNVMSLTPPKLTLNKIFSHPKFYLSINSYLPNLIYTLWSPLHPTKTSETRPPKESTNKTIQLQQLKKVKPDYSPNTLLSNATCPNVDIIDLRNVPNFPQLNDLTQCGDTDTLSLIIFSGDVGQIKGFELEIDLPNGFLYDGWEFASYGGTAIYNTNPSTTRPEFTINGFDSDSLIIINIGLTTDCSVDLNELLFMNFEYDYTYIDTFGVLHNCTGTYTPPIEYNSSVRIPVLNVLSPLTPDELPIESIGDEYCQEINISQDGLSSYVDSFRFDILGLAFGSGLNLNSITANGTYPVSFTHDATSQFTTALIEDYMFVGNGIPSPDDARFNTNEIFTLDVCYSLDSCPANADIPMTYAASFGCHGETCQTSSQTSFIRVRPTGSMMPTATTNLVSGPFVCGVDGEVQLTITNPNTDTDQNKYTDLSVGFETCETENLAITQVMVGTNMLPVNTFSWVGDDLNIDFSALPVGMDLDGPGGLEDLDGDGIFDDIAGGTTIPISLFLGVACGVDLPDPSSATCPSNDCPFTQFYISAETNCGNSFKHFPAGLSGFDITHGATAISNPNEYGIPIANPLLTGYDFGEFGDVGTVAAPDTQASTQEVIFCYDFESENFNACTNNDISLQITFTGAEGYIYDIEVLSAELSTDRGMTYTSAANVSTDVTWDNIDDETRQVTIALGSDAANICYKYVLEMDSIWCPPPAYWFGSQQVIDQCNDAGCGPDGCTLVRACRIATFYGNAEATDCICPIQGDVREMYRKNYGYTDASKNTQLTREEVPFDDQTRFLPCDTMIMDYYYVITDDHLMENVALSRMVLEHWYRGNSINSASISTAKLMPNPDGQELLEFSVQKVGIPYANRQILDLSTLAGCAGLGFNHSFEKLPWEDIHNLSCINSSSDIFDGSFVRFVLYNYDRINECNNSSTVGGDCLDEFLAVTNYKAGDTIRIKYAQELIKNPYRQAYISAGLDPGPESEAHTINVTAYIDIIDENGGAVCNTRAADDCAVNPVFSGTCPGFVSAVSNINVDACGGNVEHTFYMNPEIPIDWFTSEFRPIYDIMDVVDPIFAPMSYCGNAEIINYVNGVPNNIATAPDSTSNLFCLPVAGFTDDVCAIESGTTGDLIWNPKEAGAMALGIGNVDQDSITIKYDFCLLCPELINVLEYQMVYDYGYVCQNVPDRCNYDCHTTSTVCNDLGYSSSDDAWTDNIQDSLLVFLGNLGPNVTINDNRTPIDPIATTLGTGASSLIISGVPGVSEEIQAIDICNPDASETANGVTASISIPSSVRLEDIYSDAGGTTPLTTTLVSDNGVYKIYGVTLPTTTLVSSECTTIYVGTTLLFCPDPGAEPPSICITGTSGCASIELRTALAQADGCNTTEVCYAYISGEVGLQTEWFDFPTNPQLCDTMTFNVLVKNVKQLVLLDLIPTFNIPTGLTVIPNSWEVAYPGGPVTFGPWTAIPDPDSISGNSYSYTEDALWSTTIDNVGLEGVSSANTTEDENKVSFRFKATTNCDEFLSGSKLQTETTAGDPCSEGTTSSGIVDSPPLIINGADPAQNAQLLMVSDPDELNCMATVNTFGITALNISDHATADSVITCVTLPEELVYVPNSIAVVQPAGYIILSETVTTIGTQTEICFISPLIGPSSSMKLTFDAEVNTDAECGDVDVQVDIKSVEENLVCSTGNPTECDVLVQNSINPNISVEIKPPFIADDLEVYSDCSADPSTMDLYYEWTINHNGPDATNQAYTVNFYKDVDGDQAINANVDNLLGTDNGSFSVADGSTVIISGNVAVDADQSCPVLFEVVYPTACNCDRQEKYFDNITNSALSEYTEPIAMCPGSCFDIEICDYVSFSTDSIKGASGVPYIPSINWSGANCYFLPHDSTTTPVTKGPPSAFVSYDLLTNNSAGIASEEEGLLFVEQSNRSAACGGGGIAYGEAWIVAAYPYPVTVDSVFLGTGDVSGWSNTLNVYTNRPMKLEYSNDGINWTDSGASIKLPGANSVGGTALPISISAQYWRVSSTDPALNWGTSEFRLEGGGTPFSGTSPVSQTGNTVSICVPEGVGIDAPWEVAFTTGTGDCQVEEIIEIWQIDESEIIVQGDTDACENQCIDMEVVIPNEVGNGVTVNWTPVGLVDDPTALRVEACSIIANTTFTATISYNNGECQKVIDWPVTYHPENTIGITGDALDCYHLANLPALTADTGWDNYTWYQVISGTGFIASSGPTNTFTPLPGASYYVEATQSGTLCPAVSETVTIPNNSCLDLGDLPDSGAGTANVNYETLLSNNGPSHVIISGLHLGPNVDEEPDGQPSSNALGDGGDENVTVFSSNLDITPNSSIILPLSATNTTGEVAHLEAWIDWNGDGDFNDANEMILDLDDSASLGTFPNTISVNVPAGVATNTVLGVRFRLSNTNDMTPYGPADAGEIEDYLIQITCKEVCLPGTFTIRRGSRN